MSKQMQWLTIGEVARQAGVKASTLRYYESIGVLPAADRVRGRRRYDADVLQRLAVIDIAQRVGCSLEEIRELLDTADEPASQRVRALAARKLPEVEALIRRAEAMRGWLEAASACECETFDGCALFDDDPLIPMPATAPGHAPPLRRAAA